MRRYDGQTKAKVVLAPSCQGGKSKFNQIFTTGTHPLAVGSPLWMSFKHRFSWQARATIEEHQLSYAYGLGASGTNGWCWNGGTATPTPSKGHAGWNQSSWVLWCRTPRICGCFANYTSQYSGVDIDSTNWLYNAGQPLAPRHRYRFSRDKITKERLHLIA